VNMLCVKELCVSKLRVSKKSGGGGGEGEGEADRIQNKKQEANTKIWGMRRSLHFLYWGLTEWGTPEGTKDMPMSSLRHWFNDVLFASI